MSVYDVRSTRPDGPSDRAERFDLVILGAGSTAFGAALKAAELGATVAMTERRTLGGTCVNRGCLPSKNLIEAARLYHDAHHPRYPGLIAKGMGLDFGALVRQKDAVVEHYRDRKYASIIHDQEQIRVFGGHARFLDAHTVQAGDRRLRADRFVVATGSRPSVPAIPGLEDVPYLTSDLLTVDEGLELTELPESLLIVGGGYVALELGQLFARLGTRVTILERGPTLLRGYEPVAGATLLDLLRREGVDVRLNAPAARVRRDGDAVVATVAQDGRAGDVRAAKLLVATGRVP
ncbi:MAG: dihydrolipoyl dehydrogenase family protein, partial [Chloroflexota bacterium]